jgi:hypothetical protein
MFSDICDGLRVGGFLSLFKFLSLFGLSFFVFLLSTTNTNSVAQSSYTSSGEMIRR